MIVQITMVRNEKFLVEKLLPIWKKYVDGFVFLVDTSNDGTEEFLKRVSEKYNIFDIIVQERNDEILWVASEVRQTMFDTAKKYTNKIVCLDADEYFDGTMTKHELNSILDSHNDVLFNLKWIQYTSINTIRVDGPWKDNYKGRIGVFNKDYSFRYDTMHASHLPIPQTQYVIPEEKLFIAHLQWLDKNIVGLKQYCYKIEDYVSNKKFGANIVEKEAYDLSINNFNWEEEYYDYPLKINEDIYEHINNSHYYRMNIIKEKSKEFDIPNLGDWGLNIHDSIPMYFCTAADEKHYSLLLNMIGGIHKYNFYDTIEIRVYDLGLNDLQKTELRNIKKVKLCEVEKNNRYKLDNSQILSTRYSKELLSWKPVLTKDSLDYFPYVLYLDLGTNIIGPMNNLFKHIKENDYTFFDYGNSTKWMSTKYNIEKLHLNTSENEWVLNDWDIKYESYKSNVASIKRKYLLSVITGIGKLQKYEKFIDKYFDNIQQQIGFSRFEFIIVYSEWSKKFEKYTSLENVRFIKEPESLGVLNAWNLGIVNSTTEFVTNWNVDDLRLPINNKIKYDLLKSNIDIDLVYNWYVGTTPEEIEAGVDLNKKPILQYPDDYHLHTKVACMAGPDPLWRKCFHLFGGYFDIKNYSIVGDWEMWLRMSKMKLKFKLIPHVLCIYVDHNDTVSRSNDKKLEEQKIKLMQQYA